MYHYVYLTTNLINNKKYIGQHSTENLEDGYIGSGKILKTAIQKYGKENFKKEILEFANSKSELDNLEIYYIKLFNAANDNSFYNLTEGGGGTLGLSPTEEQRKKNSERMKNLFSTGQLISPCKGKFGPDNPAFGRRLTEEEKKHLSDVTRERFKNNPEIREKIYTKERSQKISDTRKKGYKDGRYKIRDVSGEKNPMYGRTKEQNPRFGVHLTEEEKRTLSKIVKSQYENGRVPPMQGKHWDDETKTKISESHKGKMTGCKNPNYGKGKQTGKPVYCVEKDVVYSSISKAAKANSCWPHQINDCLCGKRELAGNMHWKHASQANTVPSEQETA